MKINVAVADDYIQFDGSTKVARPVYISIVRWRAYWQLFAVRKLTPETLTEAQAFMAGK